MIPGLPNPWLILAVFLAFLGAYAGGNLHGHRAERRAWEAATAKLQTEAATTLAIETAKTAAAERAAADLATNLDALHAKAADDLNAARAASDKRLFNAVSRARRSCATASQAANTGEPAGSTAGSDGELERRVSERLGRVGAAAMKLALYAQTCHAWAVSVGR